MNSTNSRSRVAGWSQITALGLLVAGGCDERGLENPERPDLQPAVQSPQRDLLFPYDLRPRVLDFAWIEDLGVPSSGDLADAAVPPPDRVDLAIPDQRVPDLAMPDLAMPDLAMPDLAMPDIALRFPDLVHLDLFNPDLAMPDFSVRPPDLVTPPDMSIVPRQFAAPVWVANNVNAMALVTGDFNGDNKRDIVFCDDKKGELNPLFGNGDGTFKAGAVVATPCSWFRLDGFDVDKDGRWDVLPGGVLARGNANGTFTVTKLTNDGAVADTDGDGNIDLVNYVNAGAGMPNVHYYKYANGDFLDAGAAFVVQMAPNDKVCSGALGHKGKGSFGCWVPGISAYLPASGSPGKPIGSGEFGVPFDQMVVTRAYDTNLDGQPDGSGLITRSLVQPTSLHASANFFSSEDIPLAQGTNATFAVYDVNGDARNDIVGTDQSESQVVIAYGSFPNSVAQKIPFNLPVFGNGVALADFDGDKKIDIVVAVNDVNRSVGGVLLFRGL